MTETIQDTAVTSEVDYTTRDGIAVITLSNPPVNGLRDTLRKALGEALTRAEQDDDVRAVVLTGGGKGFCGGADLRQFGTEAAKARPTVPEVFAQILALPKPVVAAIHGFSLGGGYELALVCSHRVAHRDAILGLTEVSVGLFPGAGGTQRLPRLIGTAPALEAIQTAARVPAPRAGELGMVDRVVDGDVVEAAIALVTELDLRGPQPRIDDLPPASADGVDFDAARAGIKRNAPNKLAQSRAVDAVEVSTRLPIAEGLKAERASFQELVTGPDAVALRHVFLAEKKAAKAADIDASVPARPVESVAVIGAGTMGSGIAMAYANAGIPVVLVEQDEAALERGTATIRRTYEASAAKGRLSADEAQRRTELVTPSLDMAQIAAADLVVEAVFEDMDVKKQVFARIDEHARAGAVLATNTSRLDVDEIAASTSRPADVIGLHFFSPANVMKLLEVVRGAASADDVVVTSLTMAQRIGKVPVLSAVCDGFIGNRMLTPYRREADFLVEEGATPQQVDRALEAFGLAMGPFRMSDLAGLDIGWAARKRLAPTRDPQMRYSRVADVLCEAGRFGQKTGAGYYRYEDGSRTPVPDPEVEAVIRRCAEENGITTREITDEEIVDRCMLALVNEGARILDEDVAQRASDIDVVYVDGYGFPAYRGGPMHWAQSRGLADSLRRIQELESTHGSLTWAPAPLPERRVADGHSTWE
ncbi:3-hydroxyacyl-CoA dehydrogenase NAD-binding domain-containing protein [Janibacter terrae]|uniref:3-hydroxyacyl-CoA dehydrogenase NAD-binding domain-containing protein n=1 Tax=Janibacter terrae TaxID=103817 RepID=UPI0031F752E1